MEDWEELGEMRVVDVRDSDDLLEEIAEVVERSTRWVKKRVTEAHGATLLATLFADRWPEPEVEDDEDDEDSSEALSAEDALQILREESDRDIRSYNFGIHALPRTDVQPLMDHQADAIGKIERNGFASGILHLPTGAGKTRTALELMARIWEQDDSTLFIWASHGKNLVRQSMVRLVELLPRFSRPLAFAWLEVKDVDHHPYRFRHGNVLFATRDTLTKLLDHAASSRRKVEPLRELLLAPRNGGGRPVVLIYDECHEMGAAGLQSAWKRFHRGVLSKHKRAAERFRVFGLSATPLPSSIRAHTLLRETVFPILPQTSTEKDWGVLVHASASMAELTKRRMLCPMNLGLQKSGRFDIPDTLLDEVLEDEMPLPPSRAGLSERQWINEFSKRFNREVMSDERIVNFIANSLAENFETIGKTIVFCATIRAAEQLVAALRRHNKVPTGVVSLVHSRLEDLEVAEMDDEDEEGNAGGELETQTQIASFKERGSDPCIMVNVGMLTTGFDDPKIRTVLLARLTFSKNLFWQMIGRGLRGPAAGGTLDCHVVDPIRLTEKFEVFNGYRPTVYRRGLPENDLERSSDLLSDDDLAPVIEDGAPTVPEDPKMRDLAKDVRAALREFLRGDDYDAKRLSEILSEEVELEYGADGHVFRPLAPGEGSTAFRATLERRVMQLQERLGADLTWFYQDVPQTLDATNIEYTLRKLQKVEEQEIRTEEELRKFEMSSWG